MISIIRKLGNLYRRCFWSFERQARYTGVRMGSDNFIASHFWSTEPYLIKVGNHCAITEGVKFFTHGGGRVIRRLDPTFDTFGRVTIGDYVYLGTNSLVMPGVTIGNNVIVAAASVVTKSIPDNVVVAGNPARYVCTIDEYYERNQRHNTGTKGISAKEKKKILLSAVDGVLIQKPLMSIQK